MRILFDQGNTTPAPPRLDRPRSGDRVAAWMVGAFQCGDLLTAAEAAGFDLLITTDQNLRYQQNLSGRRIAILVLTIANWPALQPHATSIAAVVDAMQPGEYREFTPSFVATCHNASAKPLARSSPWTAACTRRSCGRSGSQNAKILKKRAPALKVFGPL